jgi:cyclophilin family peptidyl-prolyl cis-trans isomerase
MKKLTLLIFTVLGLALQPARAQQNATFDFRIGHDKTDHRIVIAVDANAAPQTVANFEKLVGDKFYDGLKIHRIIPHTLVQMGDPLSRGRDLSRLGTGGPGYTLPPEVHLHHTAGAVAMSRLPDNINPARRSSGSQFYICLKAMPELDGKYTVFGHVIQGMDDLDTLSTQPADTNNNPVPSIVIKAAYLGSVAPHSFSLWPSGLWSLDLWPWGH